MKLADRMHNMRTIEAKPHASQRRTAEETLLFFVPLAKYLRLTEAAEDLCGAGEIGISRETLYQYLRRQ